MIRPPPSSPLFPSTPLSQSKIFFLHPQLLCGENILIVPPAALLEMRTAWLAAFCRRKNDLEQVRPEEFLLPLLDSRAHFFSGQDVGHKNRVSVGVRQAIASVHELLN